MRLDLFLKWSRIILRRTLAKATCDAGKVTVNDRDAPSGRDVHVGDLIAIRLPRRILKVRVRSLPSREPGKEQAREMIDILDDRPC
jgi:ribosomal 50S subunit-recycling heat shock protein